MAEITRYELGWEEMDEDRSGDWVKYEDYAKLKKVADDLAVSVQIKIRAHEIPCGCLSCKALNAYRQMEAK